MPMKIIETITEQIKKENLTGGHVRMPDVNSNKGRTAVISVFDGVKPSYMVLNELYAWAKENNDVILSSKIDELRDDMEWCTDIEAIGENIIHKHEKEGVYSES